MTLPESVARRSTTATADERARLRCEAARAYEESGEYERARRELGDLWRGPGERPKLDGLGDEGRAIVLLRVGVLSGWLGAAKQIEGVQERAKDLISESQRVFEGLGDEERAAEAQTELGFCYWREGAHDEARVQFRDALAKLRHRESLQRAVTSLRIAAVELRATRYATALTILLEIAAVVERRGDDALKGRFHNSLAIAREHLSTGEGREEGLDTAMLEYEAALYHFEQARNLRFQAYTLNNLGHINYRRGRFEEAHTYLSRARRLFNSFGDVGNVAQVDDTRARAFFAQGKYAEAERSARTAVKGQEQGEQRGLLAEAMVTHAKALAQLSKPERALEEFHAAGQIARAAGDREGAGRAALALIESLGAGMTPRELNRAYLEADELLRDAQHPETVARLRTAASRAISKSEAAQAEVEAAIIRADAPINLRDEVKSFEGKLIKRALTITGGKLRRASRLLGLQHQTLSLILKERHKDLLAAHERPRPPKRGLMRRKDAPVPHK